MEMWKRGSSGTNNSHYDIPNPIGVEWREATTEIRLEALEIGWSRTK